MPVNAVCGELTCYTCGKKTELADSFWRERFDADSFEPFVERDRRQRASHVMTTADLEGRLAYAREPPLCPGCRAELDVDAMTPGEVTCPKCARGVPVRAADARAKLIDRRTVLLACESARETSAVTQPIVFACMHCSGSLSIDGTARTVACPYCTKPNYLPDGVWHVLYPMPVHEPFYLVCEYDEVGIRDARWEDLDERKRDAARADLAPELYARLAADEDFEVREVVAKNRAVSPELIANLLRDEEYEVRTAAVANPVAPEAALVACASGEDDDTVLKALAKRSGLPASVVEALSHSSNVDARVRAVKHDTLPVARLRELERDDDERVQKAAKHRIDELKRRGVDVPGGGFFKKLFGG
jgi:hypothetical protein